MKTHFKKYSLSVVLSVAAVFSFVSLAWAWTNPTQNPPTETGAMSVSSGNVGIGTTNPSQKLHVVSSDTSTTRIRIANSAVVTGTDLQVGPDGTAYLIQRENLPFNFYTNNAFAMGILANGKVGIGTTAPGELLHVVGSSGTGAQIGSNVSPTEVPSGVYNYLKIIGVAGQDIDRGSQLFLGGGYDNNTPTQATTVYGSVGGLKTTGDTSKNGYLSFGTNTGTAVTEKMRITDTGNVGVGTTLPTSKLLISALDSSTGTVWQNGLGADATAYVANKFASTTMTNPTAGYGNYAEFDYLKFNPVSAFANTSSNRLGYTIIPSTNSSNFSASLLGSYDQALNYGSGMTGSLYAVYGNAQNLGAGSAIGSIFGVRGYAANVTNGTNQFSTTTNAYGVYGGSANTTTNGWLANQYGVAAAVTNGGTVTTRYGVLSSASNTGTIASSYGVYATGFGVGGTHTNTAYDFYGNDSGAWNYFAGNVGIGTTNPGFALDVSGGVRSSNEIIIGPGDNKTIWFNTKENDLLRSRIRQLYDGGSGFNYLDMTMIGADNVEAASILLSQNKDIIFHTNNAEVARINTSGKIGIGMTNPVSLLSVDGANKVVGDWGTITARATDDFAVNKGGSIVFGGKYNTAGTYMDFGGIAGRNDSGVDGIKAGYLQFSTLTSGGSGATEKMRITSGGNVGIGTTNPRLPLNVVGTSGAPANSGTTPTAGMIRLSSVTTTAILDMGVGQSSPYGSWLQATDAADLSAHYPLSLNPNGGNVGIGTTNPGYPLDIQSATKMNSKTGYLTNGADYAEYFKNEEILADGDIVGLNLATGKVRKYQVGDEFIGIVSDSAGFVGNNKSGDEERSKDKDYTLVGLVGQLNFNHEMADIDGKIVKTKDGKKIGVLLENGKVFIKS